MKIIEVPQRYVRPTVVQVIQFEEWPFVEHALKTKASLYDERGFLQSPTGGYWFLNADQFNVLAFMSDGSYVLPHKEHLDRFLREFS